MVGTTPPFAENARGRTIREVERKYYSAGSSRIAMRENGTITWLLGDHLGSTSVTADASGNLLDVLKYTAFGELRSGSTATDYKYTGQREEFESGLYFYVVRYYDPVVGRFIQADTIVPGVGNPQAFNRYTYANNNPVKYSDPSGFMSTDNNEPYIKPKIPTFKDVQNKILADYSIYLDDGGCTIDEGKYIYSTLYKMEVGIDKFTNYQGNEWIQKNLGGAHISVGFNENLLKFLASLAFLGIGKNPHTVGSTVYLPSNFRNTKWSTPYYRSDTMIAHEFGHVFDNRSAGTEATVLGGGISDALMDIVGGSSINYFGIYCAPNSLKVPSANAFLPSEGFGYGNNSPADYGAQTFSATIMTPNDPHTPMLAEMWMMVVIDLTK